MLIQLLYTSLVKPSDILPLPYAMEILIGVPTEECPDPLPDDPALFTVVRYADTHDQAFAYALDAVKTAGEPVEFIIYQ